jgi:cell division control protein 24
MDHLCDQVSILLSENKGLSARLRNLEQMPSHGSSRRLIASLTSGSIEHDHNSTSARSTTSIESRIVLSLPIEQQAHDPQDDTALNPGHIEPPRDSAFEEQLHRSRVYRHAQANHSESSLLDDGRSTLALSICSSLTLGEVSNISVFALPIFANELSNAAAYDFTRTTEVITLGGPEQKYGSACFSSYLY